MPMHWFLRISAGLGALSSLSLTWISAFGTLGILGGIGNPLVALRVEPATAEVAAGGAVQYRAIGRYKDGSQKELSDAVWGSSEPGAAAVDRAGVGHGLSSGSATIRAMSGAVSGSAEMTVQGGALTGLTMTPASVMLGAGAKQQLYAHGSYSDGTQRDLTAAVNWTSSNPEVAVVDAAGVARAVSAGKATIEANSGAMSAGTTVAVAQPELVRIDVRAPVAELRIGASAQATATGTYSNGSTADLTTAVRWLSSSDSAAAVSQDGMVRGVAAGTATIRAVAGQTSGGAAVTVASAPGKAGGCDGAGSCYIRAGATGAGSGANWTDAYSGFGTGSGEVSPATMQRGVTYWIAGGNYGAQTFSAPVNGTELITVKGATKASHGSASGWQDGFAGQAVFGAGPSFMGSDYWTFDGQTRGDDWQSGYTIKFDLSGVDYHGGVINTRTMTGAASNLKFNYVEVRGSNMNYTQDGGARSHCSNYCDAGFFTGSPTNNLYVGHSWIHDVGDTQFQSNINTSGNSNGSNWVIEYNYIARDHTGDQAAGNHSEAFSSTVQNMTVRYNYFQDIVSSGVITDASGGTPDVGPWYIYGNIVFWTDKTPMNGTASGLGDGFVSMFGENMHGTSYIVGNTIANLGDQPYCSKQGTACAMYFLYLIGDDSGTPTWHIANNLVWNVQGKCVYGSAHGWKIEADYNSAYGSSFDNCGSHSQNSGGSPFAHWSPKSSQVTPWQDLDFQLAADTKPGVNSFSAIPPGCTPGVDCADVSFNGLVYGADGIYDRGAMQMGPSVSGKQQKDGKKK